MTGDTARADGLANFHNAFTGIYENTDIFRKIMAAMKGEENKAVPVKKDS